MAYQYCPFPKMLYLDGRSTVVNGAGEELARVAEGWGHVPSWTREQADAEKALVGVVLPPAGIVLPVEDAPEPEPVEDEPIAPAPDEPFVQEPTPSFVGRKHRGRK